MNASPRNAGRIPALSPGLTGCARRSEQALVFGLLLAIISGCASVDSSNTSARPWGQPSERQLTDNWLNKAEWSCWLFPLWSSRAIEQQRYDEWRHPGR